MHGTREHSQLLDIVKPAHIFSLETGPDVGNEYLCSLVKMDHSALKASVISKTGREVVNKNLNELQSRVVCLFNAFAEGATKAL